MSSSAEKAHSPSCRGCMCLAPWFSSSSKPKPKSKKRRCLWALIIIILILVIAAAIAAPIAYTGRDHGQSRWVEHDGLPPLPTGLSTIAGVSLARSRSDCITPASIWSCFQPKEEQGEQGQGVSGHRDDLPSFLISIRYADPADANRSDTGGEEALPTDEYVSWPAVPSHSDMEFLGNTTDGTAAPDYAGEPTPFWVSFVAPAGGEEARPSKTSKLAVRGTASHNGGKDESSGGHDNDGGDDDDGPLIRANMTSPNPQVFIPRPRTAGNGTSLPAQLYPHVRNQPVRLYNRGAADEHYGFYTYFERRIFLAGLTASANDTDPRDARGGSARQDATAACFWGSTRFLVQIWTARAGRQLLGGSSAGAGAKSEGFNSSEPFSLSSAAATQTATPGSFPYPVTVTVDRHGGVVHDKMVYCYGLDGDGRYVLEQNRVVEEERGKGGRLVAAAPALYLTRSTRRSLLGAVGDETDQGGGVGDAIDGGTGGCVCQYRNWE
ncbi:hypothetical protein KEM52_001833 [Ascosphaera acerosa]|nr:hypothetical protein KEM52_001833 [Ascosphaera acerosa]